MSAARAFEFGPFRVDVARRILTRDGEVVPLAPKPFALLLILLRHAGQSLSKDRLLGELWTDTVGSEANLSVNIATIRRALGESPKDHRYLVTLPQRGYSFVAEVRRLRAVPKAGSGSPLTGRGGAFPPPAGRSRRVAVLPFRVTGANPDDDHLGVGFADAITSRLSLLREWAVQSPRTVQQHAGNQSDALASGRELSVDAVLEGTIRRDADRVTATVHLVETGTGRLVWGDTFTDTSGALSLLPDRIGEFLARAVEGSLVAPAPPGAPAPHSPNPESFKQYLEGRFLLNRADPASISDSLDLFRRASEADPLFALAPAGIAEANYDLWRLGLLPSAIAAPAIETAARAALGLDDRLGDPYFWLAYLNLAYHWNWPVARVLFDQGLQRTPNSCLGHTLHAYSLVLEGGKEEALAEVRLALTLEPLNLLANASMANILRLLGRIEPAISQFQTLLSLAPDYAWGHFLHGWTLLQARRFDEALIKYETLRRDLGDNPYVHSCVGYAHAGLGNQAEAHACHRKLMALAETRRTDPYPIAFSYLGLGDQDRTLEWLGRAFEERNPVMTYLGVEPLWAPLRGDSRFDDIVSLIGSPAS